LAVGSSLDSEVLLDAHVVASNRGFVDGGGGRHVERGSRVETCELLSLFHAGRDRVEHDPFRRYYPDQVRNRIISERIQQRPTLTLKQRNHNSMMVRRCRKRTPVHAVYLAVKVPRRLEDNAHVRNMFCIVVAILGRDEYLHDGQPSFSTTLKQWMSTDTE
jgi:hypothetical protein